MCVHKQTGQRYAIKIIDKKKFNAGKEALMGEVRILQQLKHPHIISINDVFETDRYLYLILELCAPSALWISIPESLTTPPASRAAISSTALCSARCTPKR